MPKKKMLSTAQHRDKQPGIENIDVIINRASVPFYRVYCAAPGPIWTPLIPSSFPPKHVSTFGSDVPMGMAGQPDETAPSCVFPAYDDSLYVTGQVLHPNEGEIVNG